MRKHKIEYYLHGGTQNALNSFYRQLPKMGRIVKVTGAYEGTRKWYRVRFHNDKGQQWVYAGFAWWYGGQGSRGIVEVLTFLGVPEQQAIQLLSYDYKGHEDYENGFIAHITDAKEYSKQDIDKRKKIVKLQEQIRSLKMVRKYRKARGFMLEVQNIDKRITEIEIELTNIESIVDSYVAFELYV